jgi:hypothetical protein
MVEYHHLQSQAGKNLINTNLHRGKLSGIRCPNIGGRNNATWAHWFIRKSVAIAWTPPTKKDLTGGWTKKSDEFIIRARKEGRIYEDIAAMMRWPQKRVEYRAKLLKREGRL